MRVLLVEDEGHKINDLTQNIRKVVGKGPSLDVVSSVRDAVLRIAASDFDVLVLDMALPTFSGKGEKGGVAQSGGGIEVLRAMKDHRRRAKVIVVSQYPDVLLSGKRVPLIELTSQLKVRYGTNIIGALQYSYTVRDWEGEFTVLMERFA